MINDMSILAIIPARGGSKGFPRKNLSDLCGKPLIAWTIEAALDSSFIDHVVVTTDDPEIALVSEKYGARVPFYRPKELATDTATSSSVILHALDWFLKNEEKKYPIFILLQPTSPLRDYKHIDESLKIFMNSPKAKSLVSVRKVIDHPAWMKKINAEGFLHDFMEGSNLYTRRQELPEIFIPNGAIYIMRTNDFLISKTFYVTECTFYIMDDKTSIDIDSRIDFQLIKLIKKEDE